jgi:hypothetical protein
VRNIEDSRGSAYRVVLADLRAVLDGHIPPAEVDDLRPQLLMQGKQRCSSSHRASGHLKQKRTAGTDSISTCRPSVL